jgi:hypothetical protein
MKRFMSRSISDLKKELKKFKLTPNHERLITKRLGELFQFDISSGGQPCECFELISESSDELRLLFSSQQTHDKEPTVYSSKNALVEIINYTPHTLNIFSADKTEIILQIPHAPDNQIPRVKEVANHAGEINEIPVISKKYLGTENLPESRENCYLIVSLLVLQANPGRTDLICPDTGAGAVRDNAGNLLGVTNFQILKGE